MQAWFLLGPEALELREIPDPTPGVDEAVVRVEAVGVCGSDTEAFEGTHPLPNYPRLPGHEFAGEVVAVGSGWRGVRAGTRVAVDPAESCGECYACRHGRHNCCARVSIAGVHRPGAMAEYAVCRAEKLTPIPETMAFDTAAVVETLSIGYQATARARIEEGDRVAILGAGPVGLCCLLMARVRGGEALVVEPLPWRRALAGELGAAACVDPRQACVAEAVRDFTDGYGANVVIDATGEVAVTESAFSLVGSAGRVMILTLADRPVPVRPWQLVRQEIDVLGSRLSLADFGELVSLVDSGRAPLEKLVTHRYPMAQAEQAFRDVSERVDGMVKSGGAAMLEELKARACRLNRELPANGLVTMTSGNLSGRDAETGLVVIKPSGVSYADLTPEDMVVVDLTGQVVEGRLKPSVDTATHLYIYGQRADVFGVVHTHSNYATAFAAVGRPIPCALTAIADEFGGCIPVGDYAQIGEEEIGREVCRSIGTCQAILMKQHGVFTIGDSPEAALKAAVMVEDVARTCFLAMQLGRLEELPAEEIARAHRRYVEKYGQK